jgi:integrase/recombinase XerD
MKALQSPRTAVVPRTLTKVKKNLFTLFRKIFRIRTSTLFIQVLPEYIKKDHLENKPKKATTDKHDFQYLNILRFLHASKLNGIQVHKLKIKHMEQMRVWLHKNVTQSNGQPCSVDHVSRHLRMCREACAYAVDQEYMPHNGIVDVKTKRSPDKEVVSLSVDEVERLEKYIADIDQWNIIRDLFLFQCFTGISYMDLWLFKIVWDREMWWVTCATGRGKNQKMYWAEYTRKAQVIYNKYNCGNFPRICLQTYNKTIKKIAVELNIQKNLTTHIGRKTFANLKRNEGYSEAAISGMMGNTEEVLRKHYLVPGKEHVINERERLKAIPIRPKQRSKKLAA